MHFRQWLTCVCFGWKSHCPVLVLDMRCCRIVGSAHDGHQTFVPSKTPCSSQRHPSRDALPKYPKVCNARYMLVDPVCSRVKIVHFSEWFYFFQRTNEFLLKYFSTQLGNCFVWKNNAVNWKGKATQTHRQTYRALMVNQILVLWHFIIWQCGRIQNSILVYKRLRQFLIYIDTHHSFASNNKYTCCVLCGISLFFLVRRVMLHNASATDKPAS